MFKRLFKRLKNIKDNLVEDDDNDNKVGTFRIIKDIKDKGIKIDNDDEAIREIKLLYFLIISLFLSIIILIYIQLLF